MEFAKLRSVDRDTNSTFWNPSPAMNNPVKIPLLECIIQLNFSGDARIDAVRGLFQQEIRGEFPLLLVSNAMPNTAPAVQPYQFATSNRTRYINIAVNSFAYGTKEYPGWDKHRDDFLKFWRKIETHIHPSMFTAVSMRYMNQFSSDETGGFPINSSTPCFAPLHSKPDQFQSAMLIKEEPGHLIVQVELQKEPNTIKFDLDAQLTDISTDKLDQILDQLHGRIERYFIEAINPSYAKLIVPSKT